MLHWCATSDLLSFILILASFYVHIKMKFIYSVNVYRDIRGFQAAGIFNLKVAATSGEKFMVHEELDGRRIEKASGFAIEKQLLRKIFSV